MTHSEAPDYSAIDPAKLKLARAMIWEAFDGGPPFDVPVLWSLERHYLTLIADGVIPIPENYAPPTVAEARKE